MEKLILTGASGLLGSKICEFARKSYRVTPLHNTRPLHPNSLKLDITNPNQVSHLFNNSKPYIVVHTASETNVDKCETQEEHAWNVNVEGTRNVAEAAPKQARN